MEMQKPPGRSALRSKSHFNKIKHVRQDKIFTTFLVGSIEISQLIILTNSSEVLMILTMKTRYDRSQGDLWHCISF